MLATDHNLITFATTIKAWGRELGFADIHISDVDLAQQEAGVQAWLELGYHGEMDYMAAHGMKRARPAELVPGTIRSIMARMDYLRREYQADGVAWRRRKQARLEPDARPARPRCRCMRVAAIITRCCVRACNSWPTASRIRSANSVIGYSPIRRR